MALGSCTDGIVKSADILFPELQIASSGFLYEIVFTCLRVYRDSCTCVCLTSEMRSTEGIV